MLPHPSLHKLFRKLFHTSPFQLSIILPVVLEEKHQRAEQRLVGLSIEYVPRPQFAKERAGVHELLLEVCMSWLEVPPRDGSGVEFEPEYTRQQRWGGGDSMQLSRGGEERYERTRSSQWTLCDERKEDRLDDLERETGQHTETLVVHGMWGRKERKKGTLEWE